MPTACSHSRIETEAGPSRSSWRGEDLPYGRTRVLRLLEQVHLAQRAHYTPSLGPRRSRNQDVWS